MCKYQSAHCRRIYIHFREVHVTCLELGKRRHNRTSWDRQQKASLIQHTAIRQRKWERTVTTDPPEIASEMPPDAHHARYAVSRNKGV